MSYSHWKKISFIKSLAFGKKGEEVELIDADGNLLGNMIGNISGGQVNPTVECVADGTISKGDLVYPSGFNTASGKLTMAKAEANGSNPSRVAWFVAPEDIADTEQGIVVGIFELTGVDTDSESVGDPVYLSNTAGEWTDTAPSGGGEAIQQVGVVTVSDSSEGKVILMPFYSKSISVNTGT